MEIEVPDRHVKQFNSIVACGDWLRISQKHTRPKSRQVIPRPPPEILREAAPITLLEMEGLIQTCSTLLGIIEQKFVEAIQRSPDDPVVYRALVVIDEIYSFNHGFAIWLNDEKFSPEILSKCDRMTELFNETVTCLNIEHGLTSRMVHRAIGRSHRNGLFARPAWVKELVLDTRTP